jgi:hypothetical protein
MRVQLLGVRALDGPDGQPVTPHLTFVLCLVLNGTAFRTPPIPGSNPSFSIVSH